MNRNIIIKQKPISNLDKNDYNHLCELNLEFAKRYDIKMKVPDEYNNIVKEDFESGKYILYGMFTSEQFDIFNDYSKIRLFHAAECVITKSGKIIKNRFGDQE